MTESRSFWQDRPLLRHYLMNVLVGVVIALAFTVTAESRWGEGLRDAAFDLLVRYEYHNASQSPGAQPLFFVEITPAEYRQWGEPLLTPRDRVADLIEAAWHKGAPVVVLDILLDRPDREHPQADARLRLLLERMLRENAGTKVVFPVRIGTEGELRPHLFDDLLQRTTADGRRLFYPAVPTVLASELDLLHRFWGMYQLGRDQNGETRVIWSVPLLAAALHSGSQERLDAAARDLLAGARHGGAQHASELQLQLGAAHLHLPAIESVPISGSSHPVYRAGESHGLPYAQRVRFLIPRQTSAKRDAGNFRAGLSPQSLAGKIVVIGNGSPETGDVLSTPVGQMPGMYLIGNAINTIVANRMPAHLNGWLHLAAEAFTIALAAWFFLRFETVPAQLVSSLLLLLLFLPLSWFIYRYSGVFFNFIVPVAGMRLHAVVDSMETAWANKGRKRHAQH